MYSLEVSNDGVRGDVIYITEEHAKGQRNDVRHPVPLKYAFAEV